MRTARAFGVVVGAVAVVVVAGAIAWATIPGPDGVIHGCYAKSTGALRVYTPKRSFGNCAANENPIAWNQQGPPGPPALAAAFESASFDPIDLGRQPTTVASLSLPPGTYVIWGKGEIFSGENDSFDSCRLQHSGKDIDSAIVSTEGIRVGSRGLNETMPVVLQAMAGSGATSRVDMVCDADPSSGRPAFSYVRIDRVDLIAIEVASPTNTPQ